MLPAKSAFDEDAYEERLGRATMDEEDSDDDEMFHEESAPLLAGPQSWVRRRRLEDAARGWEIRRRAAPSLWLLLSSLLAAVLGLAVGVMTTAAKADGRLHASWAVAFSPVFAGNAAAIALQLAALAAFLPSAREALTPASLVGEHDREHDHDHDHDIAARRGAPSLAAAAAEAHAAQAQAASKTETSTKVQASSKHVLSVGRVLCGWTCCSPLVAVTPTVPYLCFLTWAAAWLSARLDGGLVGLSAFEVAAPLLALQALALLHLALVRGGGFLSGASTVLFLALTCSLAAKADDRLGGLSWWGVLAPLWAWLACVAAVCAFVAWSHASDGGALQLTASQVGALGAFAGAAVLALAGAVSLALQLESEGEGGEEGGGEGEGEASPVLFPGVAALWSLALLTMLAGATVVAYKQLREFVQTGLPVTRIMGAGWTTTPGLEDWGLLGRVETTHGGDDDGKSC